MAERLENCFLINAPAGSGKTTTIRSMVTEFLASNQQDQLLCITYTNRAKDELAKHIDSSRVFIGTIHSFLHSFIKQYFKHAEMLSLYFEMFDKEIKQRIKEPTKNQQEGNERYRQKYGDLTYEFVRENITVLSYNESNFTSFYYGGLSHDDLIKFSYAAFKHYPILQKCLAAKYQTIFIDEYQDSFAEVLKLFYMSVQGTTTKLYLFGDRMQQIYKNYDGSFEDELNLFDQSKQLKTNYRSIPIIVNLLNNIYNDPDIKQSSSEDMEKLQADQIPQAIFCDDVLKELEKFQAKDPKALVLRLLNKDRFKAIGAGELFTLFSKMEMYAFQKPHSAVDVLTTNDYLDNPDTLMKLLFFIEEIYTYYTSAKFGLVIQKLRAEKTMIAPESCVITSHQEKLNFQAKIKALFNLMKNKDSSIGDILNHLKDNKIIQNKYYDELQQTPDYELLYAILFKEVMNVTEYLRDPTVSTQHGVKGESHDSVIFVAETNKQNPVVHMYEFFDIWCRVDITLESLNKLYYSYSHALEIIQNTMGKKISELDKGSFPEHQQYLIEQATIIVGQYSKNQIFSETCLNPYLAFLTKKNVTAAKNCFKENALHGIVSAYKLFYVGCSRARKDLTILVDRSKIIGGETLLKEKLEMLGFKTQVK